MLALQAITAAALGHGAITSPKSRNSVDGTLAPWNGSVPEYPIPFEFWCASASAAMASKDPRNLTGSNGQACFWFSNGCDISTDECDGNTGQLVHPTFVFTGTPGTNNGWTGDIRADHTQGVVQPGGGIHARSIRTAAGQGKPLRNATMCDPNHRTINTNAECGGPDDFYYFAPWRYPGSSPVLDPCGVAGGRLPGQGSGTAGADYTNTSFAKLADQGSLLPPLKTGVVWTAGSTVEVAWTVKAFHGGGYGYRLCPANNPGGLTEACFQANHLKFVGESMLRWGGVEGKRKIFNATVVSDGTVPQGSTWAKTPIPGGPWGWKLHGATFQPICDEPKACRDAVDKKAAFMTCQCSGEGVGDIPTLEVVDQVQIPVGLPAGDWVLSWRWDCEESTQVWNSCSDVTIRG